MHAGLFYGQAQALLKDPAIKAALKQVLDTFSMKLGKSAAQQSAECLGVLLHQLQKLTSGKTAAGAGDVQQIQAATGYASAGDLEQEIKVHLLSAYNKGDTDR